MEFLGPPFVSKKPSTKNVDGLNAESHFNGHLMLGPGLEVGKFFQSQDHPQRDWLRRIMSLPQGHMQQSTGDAHGDVSLFDK